MFVSIVLLLLAAFLTQTICLDDTVVKFEIWDTAGQERYHSLAPMYYRGAQAAIVMYDITNQVVLLIILLFGKVCQPILPRQNHLYVRYCREAEAKIYVCHILLRQNHLYVTYC